MSANTAVERLSGLDAIACPHPDERKGHAISLPGRRQRMILCGRCFATMKAMIRSWHAYAIRPSTVFRTMRELGYSHLDAVRFLVQLIADRAAIRVGLLSRGHIDV